MESCPGVQHPLKTACFEVTYGQPGIRIAYAQTGPLSNQVESSSPRYTIIFSVLSSTKSQRMAMQMLQFHVRVADRFTSGFTTFSQSLYSSCTNCISFCRCQSCTSYASRAYCPRVNLKLRQRVVGIYLLRCLKRCLIE